MRRTLLSITLAAGIAAFGWLPQRALQGEQGAAQSKEPLVDFDREVRPILSDICFTCHGPDEETRQAKLRLDSKESVFEPREDYRIIVPGNSAASRLYQKISSKDETVRMPPVWSGKSLTPKQIELIRRWIDQGAHWETHWAYVAPKRPELPPVKNPAWVRNPIDRFVLARLEHEGLKPSPEADKAILLRRLSFDLTGLPPTPAEVQSFLADHSPNAYEKKVDQLLQSPHYGERLAMEWLDIARYADTHGYHIDSHREMWHWRDWVINAFNRDMPFNQFTIEQLAGDLLPNATPDQQLATGFNRNHMINFEGGAIPAEYHNEYVVDRVETTSMAWMAMTLGCARCHDHKYDPIKQRDFYRFYAFFNNAPEKGLDGMEGNAAPVLELPSADQKQKLEELNRRIAEAKAGLPEDEVENLQAAWVMTALATIPAAPVEGLSAQYEFEKDLSDSSGHNQDGKILRGGVPFDYGKVGKAADFNGETQVALGQPDAINLDQPFTIAVWMAHGAKFATSVIQKIDISQDRRGFEIAVDDGEMHGPQRPWSHLLINLAHRWPEDSIQVKTKERFSPGWHHLAILYDGSAKAAGLKLYLDGKSQDLEVVQDHLAGPISNRQPLQIGNKETGVPYRGAMDDLRLYNRQLRDDDIAQLALHEPARALLAQPSQECSQPDASGKGAATAESEDPLVEQSMENTPADRIKSHCQGEKDRLREYFLTYAAPGKFRQLHAELKDLQKQKSELEKQIPNAMVMTEMKSPRATYVLTRGDYRNATEKVDAGAPSVLPPLPRDAPRNRLGLARWLVDPANPLTARVVMNRYWQMCFGVGLVKTAENFGSQGEPPSHPELLDWLATEFIRNGWDVKAMLRLMVTSATYRQSSRVTPELQEKDPEDRLLARGPRFRLPAEVVRDNALAVSGLLNAEVGGPSVFPYQPKGLWEEMAFGDGFSAQTYVPSQGKDLYRRSMYTFWKRTVPPPMLATFDAPDREKCTARRLLTNTPLQALTLLDDPTFVEAARALARRTLVEGGEDPDQRITYCFRLATARGPKIQELSILRQLEQREMAHYRSDPAAARQLLEVGDLPDDGHLDSSELAAWTTVASTILNLDETITKE